MEVLPSPPITISITHCKGPCPLWWTFHNAHPSSVYTLNKSYSFTSPSGLGVHTSAAQPSHRGTKRHEQVLEASPRIFGMLVSYYWSESRRGMGSCWPWYFGPIESLSHGSLSSEFQGRAPLTWSKGSKGYMNKDCEVDGGRGAVKQSVNSPKKYFVL